MLELKNIVKNYYTDKKPYTALHDISLTFDQVEFVSILGSSGCGKTTLLNVIGTLDDFEDGDLIYNGKSLKDFSDKEKDAFRNNNVGFVFQNYYLIPHLNVLENVELALSVRNIEKEEVKRRALEALKIVHIEDLKDKKPNQISGGQAQRVAIARAIVTSPGYLLADEPTGSLDSQCAQEIMDLLKEISKTKLVIVVTHDEMLANKYSDRIIRMKDGTIVSDTRIHSHEHEPNIEAEERVSRLSLITTTKLALTNIFSRKWKTIMTAIVNSFGMIAIGFLLALNSGFQDYTVRVSKATASSLPVVVTSYQSHTESEDFDEINQSKPYIDSSEIYPQVSGKSQTSYTYNGISPKYVSYLDTLVEQNYIKEYVKSFSNDYSFNLTTQYPASIDGTHKAIYKMVNTTITNYNSYASVSGLPYNIFHVLYGDLDSYDLLTGSLPQDIGDLVLVVDKYNAVNFRILQELGFYSPYDQEDEVRDPENEANVRPISFDDVIGKEYQVFLNDDMYINPTVTKKKDAFGITREVTTYDNPEINSSLADEKGITLKISGILRPKKDSSISMLSSSLCYSKELQELFIQANQNSNIGATITNNIVFTAPDGSLTPALDFYNELNTIIEEFKESGSSILPTNQINTIFNKYFRYYSLTDINTVYSGFSKFFNFSKRLGIELINPDLIGRDLSDPKEIDRQIEIIYNDLFSDPTQAYKDLISIAAYCNAYSTIQCLVIFPPDLTTRPILIQKLDEFNTITPDSSLHANSEREQVFYLESEASGIMKDVAEIISLANAILLVFAVVSLSVSGSITALLISNNVLERKKEIGLLRSFGSRKSDVLSLFEIESFFIGFLAGIISGIATYLLGFIVNDIFKNHFSYYQIDGLFHFTIYHAIIMVAISIIIGLIAAFIPAYKATKVSPVTSLRSE